MSDEFGTTPPQAGAPEQPWGTPVSNGYEAAPGYTAAPPPSYDATYAAPPVAPAAGSGLSDSAAGALAYVTIIPAILFLVLDPYKDKPFVKFHAFQSLGLAVTWFCLSIIFIIPILGWIVGFLGLAALFVIWIICVLKASQGGAFKLPVIGKFAAEQSGYNG